MMVKGDDALPIQCNVADLDIVKGVARPKVFVLNTARLDDLDRRHGVAARREPRPARRRLAEGLQPADAAHAGARARARSASRRSRSSSASWPARPARRALLALLNPLAAIIPFIDPGSKKDAAERDSECAALVAHQRRDPGGGAQPEVDARAAGGRGAASAPRALSAAGAAALTRAPAQASGLRFVAEERVLRPSRATCLRPRRAPCSSASRASSGRGVARRRLDLAGFGELAARLVVAAAGFVVAFALDLVLVRCRWPCDVSFAVEGMRPRQAAAAAAFGLDDLVGDDVEAEQRARAEAHRDRHVAGVAAARHDDAADAARVVARVGGVPAVAEEDLEPGAEIHRPGPAGRRCRRGSRWCSAPGCSCSGTA